ncbi:MAG: hypothetical protein KJ882_02980 [Proteobacteria bacterium]|nr:hypothetical protein [Pseudomonadota bacterium]MBU4009707.1 hypothetical protein [Pseudomonadota bacterium]
MNKILVASAMIVLFLSGCASVPTELPEVASHSAFAAQTSGGCPSLANMSDDALTQTHKMANKVCAAAMTSPETYSIAVTDLWSDSGANIIHEPNGLPGDGMVSKEDNENASKARDSVSYELMPDFHLDRVDGKVVGTTFWIFYHRVGTLATGKKLDAPIAGRFITRDGKIVDVRLTIDFSTLTDFIAAQREWAAKNVK